MAAESLPWPAFELQLSATLLVRCRITSGAGPNCLKGKALNQRSEELSVGVNTVTHSPGLGHYSHYTRRLMVFVFKGELDCCRSCDPRDEVYSVQFAVFTRVSQDMALH